MILTVNGTTGRVKQEFTRSFSSPVPTLVVLSAQASESRTFRPSLEWSRNRGEAGYEHSGDPEPNFCTIRGLPIEDPFWTYCANHLHQRPDRFPIPLGPVFVADDAYGRKVWEPSPDTEEIRLHLLEIVRAIVEEPTEEYPAGMYTDEVVVWQLGEFREVRAIPDPERIAAFDPFVSAGRFGRARDTLVEEAEEALRKIRARQ